MSKLISVKLKKYLIDQLKDRNILVDVKECPIVVEGELCYIVTFSDINNTEHFSIYYPAKKIL